MAILDGTNGYLIVEPTSGLLKNTKKEKRQFHKTAKIFILPEDLFKNT